MKTHKGNRDINPLLLKLHIRWWLAHIVPWPFYPKKEAQYPLNRRLGGPQNQYKRGREENNLLPLLGLEPHYPKLTFTVVHYHLCNSSPGDM
jgi:hypothetical protein